MIKTLLFLIGLALVQGVPRSLKEPHPDCPDGAHRLLPHEYDCTKFYYCEGGERFIEPRECAPGTHFSALHMVCMHADSAFCDLPGSSTTEVATTTDQGSTSSTTEISNDDNILDNGCPADFNVHLLLPHETSCKKFYYCIHGEKHLRTCSEGTVFNPEIQICDHPGNVNRTCEDEDLPAEEDTDDESEDDSIEEIEVLPNGCPIDVIFSLELPHEYQCNETYQCIIGKKVDKPCAPGTDFDYRVQVSLPRKKKSIRKHHRSVTVKVCVTC